MNWVTRSIVTAMAVLFFLTACSTNTDPSETYKGETGEQIFQKGEKALRKRSYSEAVKRFEAVDVQYPYESYTETAQLHIIYAYYKTNDYASAEAAADRFIRTHPASPHVDYAYYMRGISNYYQNLGVFERFFAVDLATRDLGQIKKSYQDFAELVQRYPNSAYAPAAHQYTIYLRNLIANYELGIAQYYYRREAYMAAANRANTIVRNYEGAPAVPEALVIMVKSYRALGLTKNESDAYKVLQYNYPDSQYTRAVNVG